MDKQTGFGMWRFRGIRAGAALAAGLVWAGGALAQDTVLTYDPSQIIENEAANCAECHKNAVAAWEHSKHKITYDELHLRDEAQAILERMGASGSIRRNDECIQCHYTLHADEPGGRAKPVMGVGCQRCHGAAKDWVDLHQKTEEIPDRMARLTQSEAKGMRPTYNVYQLASSCYQCHTVPREGLVNKGQHPASSKDFELVAWANGEVRHNFLEEPGADGNRAGTKETDTNLDIAPEKKRLFFVMGKLLDIEYSLRALALSTEAGAYADAMTARVKNAESAVKGLGLDIAEVKSILAAVPQDLGPNKKDACVKAAETISTQAQQLEAKKKDYASALAKVDAALPKEYRGEVSK